MALSLEDIEGYLQKLERRFEKLEDGTLLVFMGTGQPPVAVRVAPPVVVLQVGITGAPAGDTNSHGSLYRRLLELNANELVHAAYGIEKDRIVLAAALDIDHLGFTELEAVLADIDMALANHVPELHALLQEKA
jgi:hypothetical protein